MTIIILTKGRLAGACLSAHWLSSIHKVSFHSHFKWPTRSLHAFTLEQILNSYPIHYIKAFAFSSFPITANIVFLLRQTYLKRGVDGLTQFYTTTSSRYLRFHLYSGVIVHLMYNTKSYTPTLAPFGYRVSALFPCSRLTKLTVIQLI